MNLISKMQTIALLISATILTTLSSGASTETRQAIDLGNIHVSQSKTEKGYVQIDGHSISMTQQIDQPQIPVKSFIVMGEPDQFNVKIRTELKSTIKDIKIQPATPQTCRCKDPDYWKYENHRFSLTKYREDRPMVTKTFLGDYRGTPLTKVDVLLADYDSKTEVLKLFSYIDISINAKEFKASEISRSDRASKSYLVIAPVGWGNALSEFIAHKSSQGFDVETLLVQAPQNTIDAIRALIKQDYQKRKTQFALVIGDENTIPMFALDTTGSPRTPSDLPYFAIGYLNQDQADHIPDIFSGRIVATTPQAAEAQLEKIVQQETQRSALKNQKRLNSHIIGVASNEGFNPSDAEYVTGIVRTLATATQGSSTYLYQDNEDSVPGTLNSAIDNGAFWMTYLGHGSGYAWPSMYDTYWTDHAQLIQNQDKLKPVIIDVACQNGRLVEDHLGSQLMFATGARSNQRGAVAYFGGSVNISWHPPAIMARGLAEAHASQNFTDIGTALLFGQLYLAENWDSFEDIVDNFEWYHLQGDPSFDISLR